MTGMLKPGANRIDIKVTNLWANRIIGDQQPGVQKAYTCTNYRPYTKDSPLLGSGLIDPLTVSSVTLNRINRTAFIGLAATLLPISAI